MRGLAKWWFGRVITAALALAVIISASTGAYAHAAGHCVHDQHGDNGVKASVVTATVATEAFPFPATPATVDQKNCADMVCHGCYAIVSHADTLNFVRAASPALPFASAPVGTSPLAMKRPPRTFIHA